MAAAVADGQAPLGLAPGGAVTRDRTSGWGRRATARPSVEPWAVRNPGLLEANGQRHRRYKTRRGERINAQDQVRQDRPVPPVRVDKR